MSTLSRASHALVTGGARGIGREIAATLSRAGATVTVLGRNRDTLDAAVGAGVAHFAVGADVAHRTALTGAIEEGSARPPIGILVADAGAAGTAPLAKFDA